MQKKQIFHRKALRWHTFPDFLLFIFFQNFSFLFTKGAPRFAQDLEKSFTTENLLLSLVIGWANGTAT